MSTPAKTIVLRAILPDDPSVKAALARDAPRLESDTLTLSSEKMTTETIVGHIKELSRLRDEIIQVLRQLSIPREPGTNPTNEFSYCDELDTIRQEIDDARSRYQEIQDKIGGFQTQVDDSRKLILGLTELSKTGFSNEQLDSESGDLHRVLGRVPVKKLEALQKAVQTQLREEGILAIGNKGKDTAYILVATPKDKSSQALQTLLLFDFSQVDIPEFKSNDPKTETQSQLDKIKILTTELEELMGQQDETRKSVGQVLNRRLDEISDSLVLLRGTLKLGEGAKASRIYTRLEKPLPTPTMSDMTKKGVVDVETLS